ncbi:MAG: YfcC family protein [Oscillospiraceae bacterium]|nr:YfcC family protein [Oscillospiraceae bacterium]
MHMKKFRMPTAYTILFLLLILVAAATWVIPAGAYQRAGEEEAPVAGTYQTVEQQPQGPGDVILASFQGFYDAADVALFILMVGGFLGVVMRTGAIDAGVSNVIRLLGGKEILLIPVLMILFSLGGTSFGMWEETMAFYPLLIPVFVSAGYDPLVGIAVVLLGSGAGVLASTVNPFATGIASGFAGVSLGDGLMVRLVMLVLFDAIAIWYVMAYAAKVRSHPERSLTAGSSHKFVRPAGGDVPILTFRRKVVLALFAIVFLVMTYAVIPFDEIGVPVPTLGWWFSELSGLFLAGGVIIGLVYGLGEVETVEAFVSGAADLIGVGFIIGISRGITVLMDGGQITDTVLYWGERALEGAGSVAFILLVYLIYIPLSILIPSSSGLATLSVPILAPLGEFAGIGGSLIVTAFQSASGLVNIVTPTAAVVMGGLALGEVPYDRWVRFVWKLILIFFLLTLAFLAVSAIL